MVSRPCELNYLTQCEQRQGERPRSRLTSDNQINSYGNAVHLRLHGARVLPRVPQLDIPNHNVSCRMLLSFKTRTHMHTHTHTHTDRDTHTQFHKQHGKPPAIVIQEQCRLFQPYGNKKNHKALSHVCVSWIINPWFFMQPSLLHSKKGHRKTSLCWAHMLLFCQNNYRIVFAQIAWFWWYRAIHVLRSSLMARRTSLMEAFIPPLIAILTPK